MPLVPCPHCGKQFKLLNGHITKKHNTLRVEVRKVRNNLVVEGWGEWTYSVRVLRNGEVIEDWDTPMEYGDEDCEWWIKDETKAGKWGEIIFVRVVKRDYAVGDQCEGEVLYGKDNDLFAKGNSKVQKSFGAVIVFVE